MSANRLNQPSSSRPPKRTWGRLWFLFRSAPALLGSRYVPFKLKFFFVGAVFLYWIMPDLMPFMPIDDIVFTMVLIPWFSKQAKKYEPPNASPGR
ncbi:hypothetical protein [Paenibacillus sp. UMB4589-SE434]|uniref:hypothetical protein n=1 Tax=Paenibacillus sp. UMB4589-SE434 TaxID=3046314 RepID=UPI00254ED32A|nr:hypothetical protein [Paenibacillus sp. UMB4589-SE434]MDK8182441.1 hypothetical protein [Paenibacillus sp. UMB4589-SE434]